MRHFLISLFLLQTLITQSQTMKFNWVKSFGGLGWSVPRDMHVDDSGYIYTIGVYAGKADLDPGPDSFIVESPYNSNVFVQKINRYGKLMWAKSIGGPRNEFASSITTDDSGNVFVHGSFDSIVDFNPDGKSTAAKRVSQDRYDPFIVKYNRNGTYIWTLADGRVGAEYPTSINTDAQGSIFVTEYYEADFDFSGGPYDSRITKYDRKGARKWQMTFPGGGYATIGGKEIKYTKVAKDGSVYMAGNFWKTFDANPGTPVVNITSDNNSWDVFVIKLNANGSYAWARKFGGASNEYVQNMKIDAQENIYITGLFSGFTDLDPVDGTAYFTSKGKNDFYIQKLDSNGNVTWTKTIGSAFGEGADGIEIDKVTKQIYLSGGYEMRLDFDPGAGTHFMDTIGGSDAFILVLDSMGNFLNVETYGNKGGDNALRILKDKFGSIITIGAFAAGTMDFNKQSPNRMSAVSKGYLNVYILKMNVCNGVNQSFTQKACKSYTWNGTRYTKSGTYKDTFPSFASCDSVVTMTLNIVTSDASVQQSGTTLKAQLAGATYQWINCINLTPIQNATLQTFTPSKSGDYAVVVSMNNCSDTSSCYTVTLPGSSIHSPLHNFKVYPNPVNDILQIENTGCNSESAYSITDMNGRLLQQGLLKDCMSTIPVALIESGMYIMTLKTGASEHHFKLQIQH